MKNTPIFTNIINILSENNISYLLIKHKPVYTMEQAELVCNNLPEEGVKVLFVKIYQTKKIHNYYLIVYPGNERVEFNTIVKLVNAKKIRLASKTETQNNLGIEVGSLAPFGYNRTYPIILNKLLLKQKYLYINPGVHNKTIKLKSIDLKKMIELYTSKLYLT